MLASSYSSPSLNTLSPNIKPMKVLQSPYSSNQALSMSTLDNSHISGLHDSKAFALEGSAYNPRTAVSFYASPDPISRHSLHDDQSSHNQATSRKTSGNIQQDYSYPNSATSSYGFNLSRVQNPNTKSLGISLISNYIREEVQRDHEIRRQKDLQSMEDMVRSGQTMTSIIANEKVWKKELAHANDVINDCKKYAESLKNSRQRESSLPPRINHNHTPVYSSNSQIIRTPVKPIERLIVSTAPLNRTTESWKKSSFFTPETRESSYGVSHITDSEGFWGRKGGLKDMLSRKILEEVERDSEIRRLKDLQSMEDMVRSNQTITNMIVNERKREKQLRESQINMRQLFPSQNHF